MSYKYTLLKTDGTKEDLGTLAKNLEFKGIGGLYEKLNCRTIELIPKDYWPEEYKKRGVEMFGDEEGRFVDEPQRNKHFKVLKDFENNDWDVVGNVVVEEKVK